MAKTPFRWAARQAGLLLVGFFGFLLFLERPLPLRLLQNFVRVLAQQVDALPAVELHRGQRPGKIPAGRRSQQRRQSTVVAQAGQGNQDGCDNDQGHDPKFGGLNALFARGDLTGGIGLFFFGHDFPSKGGF